MPYCKKNMPTPPLHPAVCIFISVYMCVSAFNTTWLSAEKNQNLSCNAFNQQPVTGVGISKTWTRAEDLEEVGKEKTWGEANGKVGAGARPASP